MNLRLNHLCNFYEKVTELEWTTILFFNSKAEIEIFTADENSNNIVLPTTNLRLVDEVWKS